MVLGLLLWPALPRDLAAAAPARARATVIINGRVRVDAEVARTEAEKVQGLSGRRDLGPGMGMLFVYDAPEPIGIWMKDMRFPLDILWARTGRIVRIVAGAPPPSGSQDPLPVYTDVGDFVLEVPAGFVAAHQVRPGQRFEVRGLKKRRAAP